MNVDEGTYQLTQTGSKKGYKVRWTAEGKPKEKFRINGRQGGRKKTLTEDKETYSNLSELERNLIEVKRILQSN